MGLHVICEFCNNKFKVKWASMAARKRFCNRSCRSQFFYKNGTGAKMRKAADRYRASIYIRFKITCKTCGKKFEVRRSRLNTAIFCSYRCMGLGHGPINPKSHFSAQDILKKFPNAIWIGGFKK